MNNSESITKEEVVEGIQFYYLKFNRNYSNEGTPWIVWIPITKEVYDEIQSYSNRYISVTGHSLIISNKEITMHGNYYNIDGGEIKLQHPIVITEPTQKDIVLPLSSKRSIVGNAPIEESLEDYRVRVKDAIDTIIVNEQYYIDRPIELQLLLKSLTIKMLV